MSTETGTPFAPPLPNEAHGAIRWLCTNNPFYAISAGLFFAGLWLSFGDPAQAEAAWALMSGLGGYTLLLAVTAYLLVHFAQVWDDARTVLLLVVLMFLATSVTLDEVLVLTPEHGVACYLVAFGFAVIVSERLLHGIRLLLPMLYRGPYYLILALFFFYPLFLRSLMDRANPSNEPLLWGIFGFSSVAALAFLTLLPAIRRGEEYVANNGSPWTWPLYPLTLFGLLALAVPGRAVLLCWSMHLIGVRDLWEVMFGMYFLVPFGLAGAVILLELGLVMRRASVLTAAMLLPPILVAMIPLGHHADPAYLQFLRIFTDRLGADPVLLTLFASVAFYAYAACRLVPSAAEALTATLIVLAVVRPDALKWEDVAWLPLAALIAAALVQVGLGAWRRESWRCLLGGMIAAASLAFLGEVETAPLRRVIALQFTILAMLFLGAVFDDSLAKTLRWIGAGLVLLTCLLATFGTFETPVEMDRWMLTAYPPVWAILLAVYGRWLRHHVACYVFAGIALAAWLSVFGWQGYLVLRGDYIRGLDYLVASMTLFVLAILVSLGKSGLISRWLAARRDKLPEQPTG